MHPGKTERARAMAMLAAADLLDRITSYCRQSRMAETTFGRRAVNDGKLVARLRNGRSVSLDTAARVEAFIADHPANGTGNGAPAPALTLSSRPALELPPEQNFRFFDNRQKYLLFVNTCSEKWVVAGRVNLELGSIHPRPPAVRLFDAGVGDGTVLTRVMRSMHRRFTWMPHYIVGKEISLEDIRLTLEKMPDRFHEHPATVLVMTNLYYAEAPWLTANSVTAASSMVWQEVALRGDDLGRVRGADHRSPALPRPALAGADQPEERQPDLREAGRPDPLSRGPALPARFGHPAAGQRPRGFRPGHRLPALSRARLDRVQGAEGDRAAGAGARARRPADRHSQLWRRSRARDHPAGLAGRAALPHARGRICSQATREALGNQARSLNFNAYSDARSIFRYDMHTLPNEIQEVSSSIGTSTLFAAWNAAAYVAQIEDQRLEAAMQGGSTYLDATREVLQRHKALWFNDESYIISRKRDSL